MEQLKSESYQVDYNRGSNCLNFKGAIDYNDRESCQEVLDFVREAVEGAGSAIAWDFTELNTMSSAAQGQLYRYLISKRDNTVFKLDIRGKNEIHWQQKFLPNVKKILPSARVYFS